MIRYLLLFLATVLCWSCSTNATNETPTTQEPEVVIPIKYLALGDSYTVGHSVPYEESYPIQLQSRFQMDSIEVDTTIIIATTGWTTADLSAGIDTTALQDTFDLVSLLIGVNNFFQGKPKDQYEIEFEALLQRAIDFAGGKAENVFVLSIPDYAYTPFGNGNPSISQGIDNFNASNKTITDSYGISYFNITPISREGLDKPELVDDDNLHPSGLQYGLWVDLFYEAVKLKID
ncbi:MAG: SGNH/GDSL hydrolase family protein [Bacteroidota bacterium]